MNDRHRGLTPAARCACEAESGSKRRRARAVSGVLIQAPHTLFMPPIYLLSQMNCEISVKADWERLMGGARKLASLEGAGGETEDIAQEALLLLLRHPIGGWAVRPEPYLAAVIRRLVRGDPRHDEASARPNSCGAPPRRPAVLALKRKSTSFLGRFPLLNGISPSCSWKGGRFVK